MKQETSTNVVKKEKGGALAASIFEADAAAGLGNVGHEDLALPFIKVLSQLSPEINKMDSKYVKGAEAGMIYNTVTGELFDGDKGINVIPCHYKLEFIEWKDIGTGTGAPVNIYPSSSDILSKTTRGADYKDRLPNGNYIEKTASHFVIIVGENASTALLTMKATQLVKSRKWNTMMQGIKLKGEKGLFTPASFSHIYNLRAIPESNEKGSWYGWSISKVGPVQDVSLYQQAKKFYESVSKGDVQVKHGGETSAKTQDHM